MTDDSTGQSGKSDLPVQPSKWSQIGPYLSLNRSTFDCLRRCLLPEFKLARRAGGIGDPFLYRGAESA
jgi:hypothetical protein